MKLLPTHLPAEICQIRRFPVLWLEKTDRETVGFSASGLSRPEDSRPKEPGEDWDSLALGKTSQNCGFLLPQTLSNEQVIPCYFSQLSRSTYESLFKHAASSDFSALRKPEACNFQDYSRQKKTNRAGTETRFLHSRRPPETSPFPTPPTPAPGRGGP